VRYGLVALAVVVAVGAAALTIALRAGPGRVIPAHPAVAASAPVQRDGGEGGVQIEVLYVTAEYAQRSNDARLQQWQPDRYAVFRVSMDTHTVDLSGYDMVKVSELVAGGKRYAPLRWVSISDSSHHRSGALIFPRIEPVLPVELLIKTVAGVPVRSFRWAP